MKEQQKDNREFCIRRTEETIVFSVTGADDLRDPVVCRTVIPESVELRLIRESTPDRTRERAHVTVSGPRRLKSGGPGHEITSTEWEDAQKCTWATDEVVARPDWLTDRLVEHLPEGWPAHLLGLPG
jgi:hypothetical protein